MKTNISAPRPVEANLVFSALLYSILGAAVLETQHIKAHTGVRLHLLTGAIALLVCAIAVRRYRQWWKLLDEIVPIVSRASQRSVSLRLVGSCVGLVAAGVVLALSAKTGSIAFFVICAGAFSYAPWSKIDLCRRHCFISCAMVAAGAASVLAIAGTAPAILYFMWAWALDAIALVGLLATYRPPRAIVRAVAGAAVVDEPSTHASGER